MKRTSGLAGLGIDGGSEGRSSSDHEYASSSASYDNSAPRDSRVSLGNGFSRSSTPLSHLRQPSLTTACLPASSPDLSKRSFGARMFGAFDSQDTHPESSKQGASSSAPGTSRRTPRSLPIRLLQLGYVTFALVYTTGSLLGWTGHDYSAQALIPRQAAQQLPLSAMGDAWQAVRDRVSPPQSTSLPDAVDLEVKVVEEKEKDDIESIELPIPASGRVTRGWQTPGADNNPLTSLTHPYRFSKIHPKLATSTHDQITPFAYHAAHTPDTSDITACYYTNEAWLELLPEFVSRWHGPISLVVETMHHRDSTERAELLSRLADMREKHQTLQTTTDIHLITTTTPNMTQLLTHPVAPNAFSNLARFFAKTDNIVSFPDSRLLPSVGLRKRLLSANVVKLLEAGDTVVIPTFAPLRIVNGEGKLPAPPSLTQAQNKGKDSSSEQAHHYVQEHLDTLVLPIDNWPTRKGPLVGMASSKPPSSVMNGVKSPDGPIFGLYDRSWALNHGPSNYGIWRRTAMDPQLQKLGAGLGIDGGVGGGHSVYKVDNYELHYSPLLAMSRQGHPWCNERFERNQAACGYAVWITGAELWVLPDEWAFTLEAIEMPEADLTVSEQLRESISSRLYTKYHAEACMHYGREFLSKGMWDQDRAKHLRTICGKVLGSWGMGILQSGSE